MQTSELLIDEYVKDYMAKVFYFCLRKTGSESEAEDLSSDIGLSVIGELRRGVIPENFAAYVWQIARNRYSRWAAKKHRKNELFSAEDVSEHETADDLSVENEVILSEDISLLRRELAFIAGDYRKILVAFYIEDRSVKDIALSLSLPEGTVKTRLFRARAILKEGMSMARTFGKMSYHPENLGFHMNGLDGANGEPWCYLTKALDKNILLAAYRSPSTAEELAMEIGVALPYMEEELNTLTKATLLVKRGDRYETNFYIFSAAAQEKIGAEGRRIAPEWTKALIGAYEIQKNWRDTACPGWCSDAQSAEEMRWAGLMTLHDTVGHRVLGEEWDEKAEPLKNQGPYGHTLRPNGGEWDVLGFETCDSLPAGTSCCGCVDTPEAQKMPDIKFVHYMFGAIGGHMSQHVSYREGQNLLLVAERKQSKTNKEITDGLIKRGFLREENGTLSLAFAVIQKDKLKEMPADVAEALEEKMKRATDIVRGFFRFARECIRAELPDFIENKQDALACAVATVLWMRGFVVDEAMAQGYLTVPDDGNRVKMLGATLTI